ncbi:hypothetical protein [Lysobacter sp. GCM10012299]|uniref:hypothetical protein n=1 Tax=Lysobacter sp. GCM10012299 TaxID=3317333 RepID=UPI00360FD4C1
MSHRHVWPALACAVVLALTVCSAARACDTSHLSLSGAVNVVTCSPQQDPSNCVYSGKALYQYMQAVPDSDSVYMIGLQASPWRMYDGEMRILSPEDVADLVRPELNGKLEHVELVGSWTGVSPEPGVPSQADRVSKALGGFPVRGEDGFLWLAKDGTRRTTHQAFTGREGAGSYFLPGGSEVFVSLVAGWPAYVEDQISEDDSNLLMHAAAGWDIFFLCPDKALASFERAAAKGSAIAAYNAAMMRLDRGSDGDRVAAFTLLERAAALGDAKSRARLDIERTRK